MSDNLHLIELWKKQSELFWRTVYSVPVVGIAIFAGWYALQGKHQTDLSHYLIYAGIAIMLLQTVILRRMAQYLNAFRRAAGDLIPDVPNALLGLSGYRLGTLVPIILIVLLVFMRFMNIA